MSKDKVAFLDDRPSKKPLYLWPMARIIAYQDLSKKVQFKNIEKVETQKPEKATFHGYTNRLIVQPAR